MKNSKIVAAMAAAAMAVSVMAMPAMAATTFTDDGEGAFVFDNVDVLQDNDAVIVVTYSDEHDGWGDIGFGFSEGKEWRSWAAPNAGGENVSEEYTVADIIANSGITDLSAVTFGKVEGYNGCVITNVEVKAAEEEPVEVEEPVDEEPTADEDTTPDETTTEEEYATGDLDGNGSINVTDISLLAAYIKGKKELSAAALKAADTNGDGSANVTDLSKIAAHVKGKKLL